MSKKNNVNPNHYKTAGRDRPGDAIPHEANKERFNRAQSEYTADPEHGAQRSTAIEPEQTDARDLPEESEKA